MALNIDFEGNALILDQVVNVNAGVHYKGQQYDKP